MGIVASLSLAVVVGTAFTWLSSYPVDFAIPLVVLWALGGIYAELNDPLPAIPQTFSEKQINGVQTAVLAGMALVGAGIVAKVVYVFAVQRPRALKALRESAEEKAEAPSESESDSAKSAEEAV